MAVHGNAFQEKEEIYAETIQIFKPDCKHPMYGYPIEEQSFVQ